MTDETPLFGEAGRREERTEWAVDWPVASYLNRPGEVNVAINEAHAQRMAEHTYWGPQGPYHGFVVSRTVVTFTTDWTPR